MFLTKNYLTTLLFIIIFCVSSFSQEISKIDDVVEELIAHLTENQEETQDINELYEMLVELTENPVNINSATEDDLRNLLFLNDFQIYSLLEYINQYGEFLSIYELPLVYGFSEEFVKLIEPFIIIGSSDEVEEQKSNSKIRHEVIVRSQRIIQEQLGYTDKEGTKYIGNPYKIYSRYRVKKDGKFSAGFTAEKDPGEHIFNDSLGNQIDFYSAHVSLENISFLERVVVGDYNASFGQGLLFWTGFSTGKSSYTTNINRYATKLTPYTSSIENQFLRGIGTTMRLGNFLKTSLFFSYKEIDGNIEGIDSSLSDKPVFSSFQTSGYHNTISLLEDKDAVKEMLVGLNLESIFKSGTVGITTLSHSFDAYFFKDSKPYNTLCFQGDKYQAGSIYYRFNNKKMVFFGENALTNKGDFALLNGIDFFVHPQFNLSILHRYFEPGYFSLYANGFSESGNTQNENGIYLGIKFYPFTKITINSYFDMYRFPWLRYQVDAPSEGRDYFAELIYSMSANTTFSIRFKNEIKKKDDPSGLDSKTSILTDEIINKLRLNFEYKPTNYLGFKTRLEFSDYSFAEEKENGMLIYQDVYLTPDKKPFSAQLRAAYFNIDDYNSRIYTYESDLLYLFNLTACYNNAIRFYLNLRYKFSKKLSFYVKFSQTNFISSETVGSGLNEISGDKKSEIKAQFRLKF